MPLFIFNKLNYTVICIVVQLLPVLQEDHGNQYQLLPPAPPAHHDTLTVHRLVSVFLIRNKTHQFPPPQPHHADDQLPHAPPVHQEQFIVH